MENIASIVEKAAKCKELEKKRYDEKLAQCEISIRQAQAMRQHLMAERLQCHLIASLKSLGAMAWHALSSENNWKKENVAFLSGKIPHDMAEQFIIQKAPESIRNDRDVLLARLAQDEFTTYYEIQHCVICVTSFDQLLPIRLPEQLLTDKQVVAAAVHRYPETLVQTAISWELLDDIDVFRAFLTSKRIQRIWGEATTCNGSPLCKFSEGIRGNAELMLEATVVWKTSSVVFDCFSSNLSDNQFFAIQLVERSFLVPINALERFSDRIKSDYATVLIFVQKNGLCLSHAPESLRQNEQIVCVRVVRDLFVSVHQVRTRCAYQVTRSLCWPSSKGSNALVKVIRSCG